MDRLRLCGCVHRGKPFRFRGDSPVHGHLGVFFHRPNHWRGRNASSPLELRHSYRCASHLISRQRRSPGRHRRRPCCLPSPRPLSRPFSTSLAASSHRTPLSEQSQAVAPGTSAGSWPTMGNWHHGGALFAPTGRATCGRQRSRCGMKRALHILPHHHRRTGGPGIPVPADHELTCVPTPGAHPILP